VNFDVAIERNGTFRLSGEFDLAAVEAFRTAVEAGVNGQRELIFELSALQFIDSSGIRSILELAMSTDGKAIVLKGARPAVRKVIELTGIDGREGIRTEV
jgi:anti-anti-sigma factor